MSTTLENALIATFLGLALVGGGGFVTNYVNDQICKGVVDSEHYEYCKKDEEKK